MSQQQKQFPFFYRDGRVELKDIIGVEGRSCYFVRDEIQNKELQFRREAYCYPNSDGSYRYLVIFVEP